MRRTLAILQRTVGDDNADTVFSVEDLATLLREQKRFSEAEPVYQRMIDTRRRTRGDDHPLMIDALRRIACLWRDQGNLVMAPWSCLGGPSRGGGKCLAAAIYRCFATSMMRLAY